MLKSLELIGFKSFADKTVIEFSPGITAIVGPNGSGKSNIVDAVRWILGEQSAKSLRGGEMADVIFNGSTSRRSLGLAEVTMTFDNSKRYLAVDCDEVQITRRVYRDGQGEYLINRQPSRLRDIKDLFLGSGAGQGHYCIIEQGRVDALLQASHKDRRLIFEEAAGISRFKARKTEALRKLETVEQNLARARDVLDELEKQHRSVQLQAAKAQRYQEYSQRLRELRLQWGLREFHELSTQWHAESQALERLRGELESMSAQERETEAALRRLEHDLSAHEELSRQTEAALAQTRQAIATHQTRDEYESASLIELEAELSQAQRQAAGSARALRDLRSSTAQARRDLDEIETQVEQRRQAVEQADARLNQLAELLQRDRRQLEADRAEHLERMRVASRLQNDVITLLARLDNLRIRHEGLSSRSAETVEHLAQIDRVLDELKRSEAHIQQMLLAARAELAHLEERRESLSRQIEDTEKRLADGRIERGALAGRLDLLEQWENSQEGLSAGVREFLDRVRASTSSGTEDWSFVVGLVADCLTVTHEWAAFVDLALGDVAQYVVVRDLDRLARALKLLPANHAGRIGFVSLPRPVPEVGVLELPDVGVRLDRWVRCDDPSLADLPRFLLGKTRLVDDLETACRLAERHPRRFRFLTRQGEVLEPNGVIVVGAHLPGTGMFSRKSEWRELRRQIAELDARLQELEAILTQLRAERESISEPIYFTQQRIADLVDEAQDVRVRLTQHQERRSGLHEEMSLNQSELDSLAEEIERLEVQLSDARRKAAEGEEAARQMQERAAQLEQQVTEGERQRSEWERLSTEARVELAQWEERWSAQRRRFADLAAEQSRREAELQQIEESIVAMRQRRSEGELTRLRVGQALSDSFAALDRAERRSAELLAQREQLREARRHAEERWQAVGGQRQQCVQQAHAHEMKANEWRLRLDALCQRLREEYGVELAELYDQRLRAGERGDADGSINAAAANAGAGATTTTTATATATATAPNASEAAAAPAAPDNATQSVSAAGAPGFDLDVEAAQREMDDLRKKLARLGAVNLDALEELAQLETRLNDQRAQHDDLAKSRHDLLEIIDRINTDSRKLFLETFELIRGHFQELFRKLFGGGMADIILEDQNDVLESGIEINARPPGKELRSISLLSGGERTLTAVALLLAIFRSKPSPFCLLDEVDAALDEANNERLANLLREFLDLSQFIVITHKKRTMAVADVLYGITMQEAGVSRQVSVRFEDWPDDEEATPLAA
ncbi:MAG: chromosome segregation protein SMC [Gemmataceae bacterium]|nr:chromosome segregation protein SMC [Gemmataceae bacterium]